MDRMFGKETAENLRKKLQNNSSEREKVIVNEFEDVLRKVKGRFVLKFRFLNKSGNRTSHYIFFASKEFLGFDKMKKTMREFSSKNDKEPSFEFNPHEKKQRSFEFFSPLDELEKMLLKEFKGKEFTFEEIYINHEILNQGTYFSRNDYKETIVKLEKQGKVLAEKPYNKRQKRDGKPTLAKNTKIKFLKE